MIGILWVNSLSACIFFFIPSLNDFEKPSWVWDKDLIDAEPITQFKVSFYWSYVTLVSIGYGDVTPKSIPERFFASFWMIFGVGLYSYLIGYVITMIKEYDKEQEEFQQQFEVLKDFNFTNHLPKSIFNRIYRHIKNQSVQSKFKESERLLTLIPIEL